MHATSLAGALSTASALVDAGPAQAQYLLADVSPQIVCEQAGGTYQGDGFTISAADDLGDAVLGIPAGTTGRTGTVTCRQPGGPGATAFDATFVAIKFPNRPLIITIYDRLDFGERTENFFFSVQPGGISENPHVVGAYETDKNAPFYPYHAYRYDLTTRQVVDLGTLNGVNGTSRARGTNYNGTIITGETEIVTALGLVTQAFRWIEGAGMTSIGSMLANGHSRAFGMSADGSVIVGDSAIAGGATHAFRWTQAGGFNDLGVFAGGTNSRAARISRDGTTIVGEAQKLVGGSQQTRAFRWKQATGMVELGALAGMTACTATGASANGAIVVGLCDPFFVAETGRGIDHSDQARAFVWTEQAGMRDLNTILANAGVNMTGTTLLSALAISRNGKTLSGRAILPSTAGERRGYTVNLDNALSQVPNLSAAVLPSARTTTTGGTVTGFASVINTGGFGAASGCYPSLPPGTPATFSYQQTNPATNLPIGTPNTPIAIAAGQTGTFVFSVTPTQALAREIALMFGCTNSTQAADISGVTTFQVTAAASALPDMLSIAATPSANGILQLPSTSGSAAFAMAAINIGAAGSVTVAPTDTPTGQEPRWLPLSLFICQTNASGACLAAPAPSVTLTASSNQTVTFSVFANGQGTAIPFDPANTRIFVYSKQGIQVVGATSVAVRTP